MVPAAINSRALNMAWVSRWNVASAGKFSANVAIIRPSWLRVERAMIFFMSHSAIAAVPAMSMVADEIVKRAGFNMAVVERVG